MKISIYLLSLLFLFSCAKAQGEDEMIGTIEPSSSNSPSADPNDPTQGRAEQSFGFYSHGKLSGATALPWEGQGYTKILRPRNRRYASEDLILIITKISSEFVQIFPNYRDSIQIGDIAAENGGFLFGHDSHQNGLDADIAFLRKDETMQDVEDVSGFREKFVKSGKLTSNFDIERNWALAKLMVSTGRPQRIFVNKVVKKAFCQFAKQKGELESQAETLHRLQSYPGHEDHFHMRITCPLNSPKCKAQVEIRAGTGC